MRYATDTVDGLGFGKCDPYWNMTRWGARRRARKLGPNARIRFFATFTKTIREVPV